METKTGISAEQIEYRGWKNVWRLSNGVVGLHVVADVGPRILRFGFVGDVNEFYEVEAQAGLTGGDEFRMYGGHRFWVAPETDRTTFPDNRPVEVTTSADGAKFVAPVESSGLQKTVEISLAEGTAYLTVRHTVANRADTPTSAAPWALTVLAPGGTAILPLPERAPWGPEHLLPVASMALWSYTDLTLPCWRPGTKYIQLHQTQVAAHGFGMQKLGLRNAAGWGAYFNNGHLFAKRNARREGTYVDFDSNFETYAEKNFIELETLGPDTHLNPGASVEHVEHWALFKDVPSGATDEWIDQHVLARLESWPIES